MPATSHSATPAPQLPKNRYSVLDDETVKIARLDSKRAASGALRSARELAGTMPLAELERLQRQTLFPADPRLAITDVVPVGGEIMSNRPFALRVAFAASPQSAPVLMSVRVEWAGEPFVVEKRISAGEARSGAVVLRFDARQTLPVGPAVFRTTLFSRAGAKACFRITCYVLPSNPFALSLGPAENFVTGAFSARGVRKGQAFDTGVEATLSNGNNSIVKMTGKFTWKFWSSGVGSSIVEQGTGDLGAFNVPAKGTAGRTINFHSPKGGGIFDKYDDKQDMTIEISMSRKDGGASVSNTITTRTMFKFGVNVTKVALEDFTSGQQSADLVTASHILRNIYEKVDITVTLANRFIKKADAGDYETITEDSDASDLCSDWSGPDSNDNIDMFVVNSFAIAQDDGSTADGIDPGVPGPASHGGGSSGAVCSKKGFVASGGVRRLHTEYLGMLMAHELGHYLGLQHQNVFGNLMLPDSSPTDTDLSYQQYKTVIQHDWVFID